MRAFARAESGSDELLREALLAVSSEGRTRELRPEELVIALKRAEARIAPQLGLDDRTRSAMRTRMLRGMLEAYYR